MSTVSTYLLDKLTPLLTFYLQQMYADKLASYSTKMFNNYRILMHQTEKQSEKVTTTGIL